MGQRSNLKGRHDGHYYDIDVITQAYRLLLCLHRGCFDKSGKLPREMISKCLYVIRGGHEQFRRCKTNKPTPLNSTDLCTTWGAMG